MQQILDFEKPIYDLEKEILRLKKEGKDYHKEKEDRKNLIRDIYNSISDWDIVQIARHSDRPRFIDYRSSLFSDAIDIHGDRCYGDDKSLISGLCKFRGIDCVFLGQEKGHDLQSRLKCNFGMSHPEGYRKAIRMMKMAEKFSLPIIAFIDTPGAYPGIDAEERGQASAIAHSIEQSFYLNVPFISVIIGEGGSGGAIAISSSDSVMMLSYSIYSVISPEGCAAILWKNPLYAKNAAESMKISSSYLLEQGLIDRIIHEPHGGAHRYRHSVIQSVGDAIEEELKKFMEKPELCSMEKKREKFQSSRYVLSF